MSNFDWVTARANCSLTKAFASLKAEIRRDIDVRNELLEKHRDFKFDLTDNKNSFTVHTLSDRPTSDKGVTIELTDGALLVKDDKGDGLFGATLTLNSSGECRFVVNSQECESWYVRKLALEKLFFWDL